MYSNKVVETYMTLCERLPEGDKTTNLAWAIKLAAEVSLVKIDQRQNNEYISEETWNKIQERQKARQQGRTEDEHKLSKEIRERY